MRSEIAEFATYVTLAYHEARNVRHLVRAGYLNEARHRLLITGMPTNREEAWKALEPLRREAANAVSARAAENVFRRRFDLSLEDLVAISENPHWSGTQRGGNRWAQINRALIELRAAIDQKDERRANELLDQLPSMRHNTGLLGAKLKSFVG
ncbi:MAG: hypothetical protein ACLQOO_20815 [Terriglobia bacterium]